MSVSTYESETDFQVAVIELARACGWHVVHFPDSRWATQGGWPDLSMVRSDGRVILAELKTEKGRLSAKQKGLGECFAKVEDRLDELAEATFQAAESKMLPGPKWDCDAYELRKAFRYFVWRPSDWHDIETVLADGREHL